jgi:thioredoxin 1
VQESLTWQSASVEGSPRDATGRGVLRLAHTTMLLGLMCAVGCAGEKLKSIQGMEQFQQEVLASPQPVLLAIYKGGCATCVALDPVLEQLNEEYKGRAVVAKFMLMTFFFQNTSPELREKYDIQFYPTVLLFVNGQEKQRWVISYKADGYREHLDRWLAPTAQAPGQAVTRVISRPISALAPRAPASITEGGPPQATR